MRDEFINKLNNQEYISMALYLNVLNTNKEVIPRDFNIDKYNEEILDKEYLKHKEYFENMYKGIDDNIKLDEEQIKAILAEEDYALIIAGAGTGKTTTMTSKVKYLVDYKKVDPSKILVMSFTKKAVNELSERIVDKFNIPAKVTTFHSLGLQYIREIYSNRKCAIVGNNDKQYIFLDYIKTKFLNKEEIQEMIEVFQSLKKNNSMFGNFFKENYRNYNTYDEFFKAYKDKKMRETKEIGFEIVIEKYKERNSISETIRTIKGEIVKSVSEMIIANFLYSNGIDYKYEEIYEETIEDRRTYRPDFTLDLAGIPVYLEYFGMNDSGYNRIKKLKREYHDKNKNLYIEIDRVNIEQLEFILINKLRELGFNLVKRSNEEIYERILDNNPLAQIFNLKDFIYSNCIDKIKGSLKREEYREIILNYIETMIPEEKEIAMKQFNYINEFYLFYQKSLYGSPDIYLFDYPDLLYYANVYIDRVSKRKTEFDYIIIDEYQDISKERYELTKKTADRHGSKIFAVGDDWQSIYAFSGSRIEYFYDFEKYFKGAKLFQINKTYRNSQELIDYVGTFIMKNETQIKKDLVSDKHNERPIILAGYDTSNIEDNKKRQQEEINTVKRIILKIHEENPTHKILILGRTNAIVDRLFKDPQLKDDIETKVTFMDHKDIEIQAMTMHKSKGLTFDEVIVIGLNKSFPKDKYGIYWLEDLFDNALYDEDYAFAEERRLFYVALTRTKNRVFLLTNKDTKEISPFLGELYSIVKKS